MSALPPEQTDQARVRQSAEKLVRSVGAQEDSADRRTKLAADRTVLAAERTFAAWVRTGLGALASGVGAKALFAAILPAWFGNVTGSLLILFSAFCFIAGVWRELTPGLRPRLVMHRLPTPLLILGNGFLVVVALVSLVGIWVAK